MCCEQLKNRIIGLKRDIAIKEKRIEELEEQSKTHQIIEEIERLGNEVFEMKQDVIRLNNQYKQNCQ